MQISPYQNNLEKLITKVKKHTSISHMKGPNRYGEIQPIANWQDKAWQYQNNRGQKTNFYFVRDPKRKSFSFGTVNQYALIPSPRHELLKVYALHVAGKQIGTVKKINSHAIARKFLSEIDLLSYNSNVATSFVDDEGFTDSSYINLLNQFLRWLKEHQLIPQSIQEVKHKGNRLTGEEKLTRRSGKLPDEKAILVLGAIQYEVISQDITKWNTQPLAPQRDAFVCAMTTLALSSPNRVVAEQTVLNLQRLKTITQQVGDKKRTVNYLDWPGSKGFDDNKNHILSSMAPTVDHILKYLDAITAENRVLARFYKNPYASLKVVLGTYRVSDEKWKEVQLDIDKPVNMFVLGYMLGFYVSKAVIKKVQVSQDTPDAVKSITRGGRYIHYYKPLYRLQADDVMIVNSVTLSGVLALLSKDTKIHKSMNLYGNLKVTDLQKRWILYIKSWFPNFPELRNATVDGKCDAEYRLFALSGHQLNIKAGKYPAQKSPFSIVSPSTLGEVYQADLGHSRSTTIFQRHGFSKKLSLRPNQFRHYLNDAADKCGLPRVIINMWSGRKDPSQIIHYVHSTDDERSDVIADILYNEEEVTVEKAKKSIRLTTREDFDEQTGGIASVTSSGLCTQNLLVTPCSFLNDFNVQCILCPKSCHIAHDETAVELFKKDLEVQTVRLKKVSTNQSFLTSKAMQEWFKLHLSNTEKLKQLIELITDPSIEKGTLIRMLVNENEFRISNMKTKQVKIRKLVLPCIEQALTQLLTDKKMDKKDNVIEELLRLI